MLQNEVADLGQEDARPELDQRVEAPVVRSVSRHTSMGVKSRAFPQEASPIPTMVVHHTVVRVKEAWMSTPHAHRGGCAAGA